MLVDEDENSLTSRRRKDLVSEGYFLCLENTKPAWLVGRRVRVMHMHTRKYWHAFVCVRVKGRVEDIMLTRLVARKIDNYEPA